MRFKLDENVGVRFAALFREQGHDATTVHEEGLSGAEDESVFRRAIDEERTLVTLDLDFSNPLRFPARGTAGVVVVRPRRPLLSLVEGTLRAALPRLAGGDVAGRLWIVEPGRIREHAAEDE